MFRRFLQSWFIDTVLITGLIVGVVILFRPEIIASVLGWIEEHSYLYESVLEVIDSGKQKSSTIFTPLNIIAVAAGLVFSYIIVWRSLWRLRRNQIFTSSNCPSCNFPMSRVNRTSIQKWLSNMVPLRRYYCKKCKKKHIRIKPFFSESNDPESHARVSSPERISIGYTK